MKLPQVQINPTSRIAATFHVFYLLLLPLLVLVLLRWGFTTFAFLVIVLSKWRMFAVKPRYWLANIRANSVDIIVGFAVVVFMSQSDTLMTNLIWSGLYSLWLIILKPKSTPLFITVQALTAQGLGLVALFNNFSSWNPAYLVLLTWLICYCSSRHLLMAFEDESTRQVSHLWALFGAQIALIFGHWHIVYAGVVPLIALLLSVIGYALALGYYLEKTGGLGGGLRRQLIIFVFIIIAFMIVFTDWQTETF